MRLQVRQRASRAKKYMMPQLGKETPSLAGLIASLLGRNDISPSEIRTANCPAKAGEHYSQLLSTRLERANDSAGSPKIASKLSLARALPFDGAQLDGWKTKVSRAIQHEEGSSMSDNLEVEGYRRCSTISQSRTVMTAPEGSKAPSPTDVATMAGKFWTQQNESTTQAEGEIGYGIPSPSLPLLRTLEGWLT